VRAVEDAGVPGGELAADLFEVVDGRRQLTQQRVGVERDGDIPWSEFAGLQAL